MKLQITLRGSNYAFKDLRDIMAKANELKSGDELAGLAATDMTERVGAKLLLSEVTMEDIRNHPLLDPAQDEISHLIEDDVDETTYRALALKTVAEMREYILDSNHTGEDVLAVGKGMTSEMIAAVCKVMSNLDLIQAASKIQVITTCNTSIGQRGILASRLQPNHPTDHVGGMKAAIYEGLSYGIGDALIGINPVIDTTENIKSLLHGIKDVIERWSIPTQNCVLSHVTSQMRAIRDGAPADLLFQSIAGSEAGNQAFGISLDLLREADALIHERGTATGPNRWYFETGQGSELSSDAHFGIDQLTMEARCYGLARHFKPFIVNTVVGFIGPEYLYDSKQVIRAGLEDHFMGKMHGLPMGVDVCYTNHMQADQNDMENLGVLLSAAGVNFLIGVAMADDCMLNYQSMSFHDIASLRETLGKPAAPEFAVWLERQGIYAGGRLTDAAGHMTRFAV